MSVQLPTMRQALINADKRVAQVARSAPIPIVKNIRMRMAHGNALKHAEKYAKHALAQNNLEAVKEAEVLKRRKQCSAGTMRSITDVLGVSSIVAGFSMLCAGAVASDVSHAAHYVEYPHTVNGNEQQALQYGDDVRHVRVEGLDKQYYAWNEKSHRLTFSYPEDHQFNKQPVTIIVENNNGTTTTDRMVFNKADVVGALPIEASAHSTIDQDNAYDGNFTNAVKIKVPDNVTTLDPETRTALENLGFNVNDSELKTKHTLTLSVNGDKQISSNDMDFKFKDDHGHTFVQKVDIHHDATQAEAPPAKSKGKATYQSHDITVQQKDEGVLKLSDFNALLAESLKSDGTSDLVIKGDKHVMSESDFNRLVENKPNINALHAAGTLGLVGGAAASVAANPNKAFATKYLTAQSLPDKAPAASKPAPQPSATAAKNAAPTVSKVDAKPTQYRVVKDDSNTSGTLPPRYWAYYGVPCGRLC